MAISVLELIAKRAIFQPFSSFPGVPFHLGMNFSGDSRGSENGNFCTRVN